MNPNFVLRDPNQVQQMVPPPEDPKPLVRGPRFMGMSNNTYDALKRDLDLDIVINNELKRTLLQGANPYLEFVDLLLASSPSFTSRSEFIYDVDFFDNHVELDAEGKRIRSTRDADLRQKNNSTLDYREFDPDEEVSEEEEEEDEDEWFGNAEIALLTKHLAASDSIPALLARIFTSPKLASISEPIRKWFNDAKPEPLPIKGFIGLKIGEGEKEEERIRLLVAAVDMAMLHGAELIDAATTLHSRWYADKFKAVMNKLHDMVVYPILKAWKGFKHVGNLTVDVGRYIWQRSMSITDTVKNYLIGSLIGPEIQLHLEHTFHEDHQPFIGKQVEEYLTKTRADPMAEYNQLIEGFSAQFVISAFNRAAHHMRPEMNISEVAMTPPSAAQFRERLLEIIFAHAVPTRRGPIIETPVPFIGNIVEVTLSGDRRATRVEEDDQGNFTVSYGEAKELDSLDPLTIIINNLSREQKKRQHAKQSQWLAQLLPWASIMKTLSQLDETVRDEKKMADYWVHPIRWAIRTIKARVTANTEAILKELTAKVEERSAVKSLRALVEDLQRNIGLLPDVDDKNVQRKGVGGVPLFQPGERKKELTDAQDRFKKAKDAYDNAIGTPGYKDFKEAYLDTKKEYEEMQQKFDSTLRDYKRLQHVLHQIDENRDTLIANIKVMYEGIEESITAYEKALDRKISAVKTLDESKQSIDDFKTMIEAQKQSYKDDFTKDLEQSYRQQFQQQYQRQARGLELNQTHEDEFVKRKMANNHSIKITVRKIDKLFHYLSLVAMIVKDVNMRPAATAPQNYDDINVNKARLEAYRDVLVVLKMTDYHTLFPVADTDMIKSPLLDNLKNVEMELLHNFQKEDDLTDAKIVQYNQAIVAQKAFEAHGLEDWRKMQKRNRYFIYNPDDDIRYNMFQLFHHRLTTMDLNFYAVLMKEKTKGCIQMASDEINLIARPAGDPFSIDQLISSPIINGNFAKFVMFIYEGRGVAGAAKVARSLVPLANANFQVRAANTNRTRFNMMEDGQFMEGVVNFFKDVLLNPQTGLLVYMANSSTLPLTPWQQQQQQRLQQVGHFQAPVQNFRVNIPVLKPYKITSDDGSKRQRLDFHY